MARRAVPSFRILWQQHETLYQRLFCAALERLAEDRCDITEENAISERLCPILSALCFEASGRKNCEIPTPDWEKPIQPVVESELKGGRGAKRPDFTCKRTNPFAVSADEHEIPFHVECKRLGTSAGSGWVLNENYVTNGIKRFDCAIHQYGKRASSGMMIGYVLGMSPQIILSEVNAYQRHHCPNNPEIVFNFDGRTVEECEQRLKREHVQPWNFKLIHLWVNLKKKET